MSTLREVGGLGAPVRAGQATSADQASDQVQVYCRVRPHHDEAAQKSCLTVNGELSQVLLHSTSGDKAFTFDFAGDEETTQEEVFRAVGVPISEACMAGYNGTIFAYGQTGSGKTYTILGPDVGGGAEDMEEGGDEHLGMSEESGLTPRVLAYIFSQIARQERTTDGDTTFLCKASYLEIYNEHITDLLGDGSGVPARLREDLRRGIYVEGLETVHVASAREALEVLGRGTAARHVAATLMNSQSSRSHGVFTVRAGVPAHSGPLQRCPPPRVSHPPLPLCWGPLPAHRRISRGQGGRPHGAALRAIQSRRPRRI